MSQHVPYRRWKPQQKRRWIMFWRNPANVLKLLAWVADRVDVKEVVRRQKTSR